MVNLTASVEFYARKGWLPENNGSLSAHTEENKLVSISVSKAGEVKHIIILNVLYFD